MALFMAATTLFGADGAETLAMSLEQRFPDIEGVASGLVENDSNVWEVAAFFGRKPGEVELMLIAAASGARPFTITELPETGWLERVQRELPPVHAGRFRLYGRHDAGRVGENGIRLLIEASTAFGTGHHETTRGCLLALDALVGSGLAAERILDLGCGTGVLAMASARVFMTDVLASDIDPTAVETAKANVNSNGLGGQVRVIESAGFDHHEIRETAPFDLILANILELPLIELAPEFRKFTRPAGVLVLSGILDARAGRIIERFSDLGFRLADRRVLGDWATLTLTGQSSVAAA
ncbi:MAG: 50S ribosomal protein L11 methyltransferase [Paracoccaceae bacterium]|nr:50S ribosomal protein L11 methyltransferase [Paracoccaceae bacterium]